ncbi:hypothetical protein BSY240_4395 [Agrobacterium sp. RAC06]|nr:hypothetical protein BSY240_4395 [Agrobacterium sp. RAC06]
MPQSELIMRVQRPRKASMMKVAKRTKMVMPSIAFVSPSLRLITAATRGMATMVVWTGVVVLPRPIARPFAPEPF